MDDSECPKTYVCLVFTETHPLKIIIELGDPVEDLSVATVLMVVGGQLILLRPRKVTQIALYLLPEN